MLETIILTEDDTDDIMFFKLALRKIDYKFTPWIAKSCDELFTILDEMIKIPEMIFLDLNMPCVDGFECLKKIRNISLLDTCKVVILTTSSNTENLIKSRSLGADLYVTKPSDHSKLISVLNSLLIEGDNGSEFVYKIK